MEVDVGDARELPLAGRDLDALMTRLALPKTEKERRSSSSKKSFSGNSLTTLPYIKSLTESYAIPEPVAVTFTVGFLAAIDTSSSFLNRERVAFASTWKPVSVIALERGSFAKVGEGAASVFDNSAL
ncbi:hypothetical protein V6N12_076008 [Hibiscus sabdariffa]|uniref:Uncharacterized protein n=1 Tax=Hibiscus sabdariffa TaxID=183260 RepID=A0ABR2AY73_9ROSI